MASIVSTMRTSPRTIADYVRTMTTRQLLVAAGTAAAVLVLVGVGTVMIPNSLFAREIAPTWWSYPVWVLTAVLSGLLAATYVVPRGGEAPDDTVHEGRWGIAGTLLTWFAVGCPVCNKIALLALGYSGALAYFAPVQPVLAVLAVALLWFALARRSEGVAACAVPA
ncbi:hypothetical protein [Gordonia shandongensis]|uniref:hypothetical protein n=1 Tax=Gordonia shandongensis TaxID=376351 RepID=UPI000686F4C5|nr:hypothetical protein [Gordonia shandongensis]